ncbi:hypothetical protein PF008_g28655 [Phytophthora fragariae]|uniref:ABC transporter domain-containing protein n=1 Tax=Phytophthora fragariae TaxID=53985 RepID=A0A6G0QAN1_9STRA|nr:hypothetical protein PF008_g28655 [Phytophthora fragariae]
MSVLFRVVEIPTTGRVLIDGVDIATITVHQLRTKLTIIPQDPMLFSGSLRMNLDPFAEKSDAELFQVLRKVHLSDTVAAWGKGLDYEVAEKGENLSVGQRQLLCIARALIRDSKVIVMDEATANVDQESDKLIQQTMKESFGGGDSTVLCIAHRIETIMDSDKILVLDAGEVVEFDTPSALLQVKNGVFKSLVSSSKKKTIEHQLLRLHVLLGDDEQQLDEVYQAFQEIDRSGKDQLKNANEVESVLREFLSPKNMKTIDVEKLVARFPAPNKGFDYTAFCNTLQQPPALQPQQQQTGRQSPSNRKLRSPTKLQQREQARMRIDQRLESQRLLMESVRHKLIRGVLGDDIDGYHGIQTALHRLDVAGEGYLDANVFMKKFIQRLKCPLTRPEREFLLEQLRAQSTSKGERVLDYEQLGRICNLSSDDSLSESDTENERAKPPSPSRTSQLGSGFLAAEKRLTEFLRTPLAARNISTPNSSQDGDTPRSLFTGAEMFLEIAEGIDRDNTGLLPEDEFPRILAKCGVSIDPDLLNGMLSRFPRSTGNQINYPAFLQRYGQNPQCSRGRRELKQLVLNLLSKLAVTTTDWLRFLLHRFEKYDKKLHGSMKGVLPTEAFLRAVQGRSVVLKLTTDEAAQVTSLFLRSSTNSSPKHLHYHEFLVFVDECHRVPNAKSLPVVNAKSATAPTLPPTCPTSVELSVPEPVPGSASELDTSDMSVGDYLMHHATAHERRNFENLMDVLQDFKQRATKGEQEIAIQSIENGVKMPLGKHLLVKVQFSVAE